MTDGERCAIFDDADDTTLILHVEQSELLIKVSDERIEFVFIDAEMKRSNVVVACGRPDEVRSLLRAMKTAQEAADGGE